MKENRFTFRAIVSTLMLAAAIVSLAPVASAQQTSSNTITTSLGPNVDAVANFLAQGSNWIVAPYGIIYEANGKTRYGGGLGVGYHVSDYVVPTMRIDMLDHQFYMPSGSLQLQLPIKVGGFTVLPFAFTGIATPIGGAGSKNGDVVGIFGAGAAMRIGKHFDALADIEKWSAFPGNQYRVGFGYRF